jgi:hypothetical protein
MRRRERIAPAIKQSMAARLKRDKNEFRVGVSVRGQQSRKTDVK